MRRTLLLLTFLSATSGCRGPEASEPEPMPTSAREAPAAAETNMPGSTSPARPTEALATFGAGCYWCTEAVLERLPGVLDVRAGFMGGRVPDPTYDQVCGGDTGHIEVVQVRYDPRQIAFDELLAWFWQLHDPTSWDRQGGDAGEQYRSAIFYHDEAQRAAAEKAKAEAQAQFAQPIVTEIRPAGPFYEAKQDHQDFYRNNQSYGYCRAVIAPKLQKLEQHGLPKQMPGGQAK